MYYLANEEAFAGLDAYFQGQWTGALINTRRGKPRTKVQWNCTDAVKEDGLKTTSAPEGWHNNLYRRMSRERPKYGRFFAAIQEEETRAKVIMAIAEAALPPTKRPKVMRYQEPLRLWLPEGTPRSPFSATSSASPSCLIASLSQIKAFLPYFLFALINTNKHIFIIS